MSKPKLALYWAASCGGCEIAVLDVHEKILDVADAFELVFWPVALDFKRKNVEAMADGEIDVCLFNGAVRTGEQEEMAELLRRKSKVMVAFGSCAHEGGIPGLANVANRDQVFDRSYLSSPSTDNPEGTLPQLKTPVPEGELTLPVFFDTVQTLDQTIPVEYYVPGCPPVADQILAVITAVLEGNLPPPGSVAGAGDKTCCDECERERSDEKSVKSFQRIHLAKPDPDKCLLEQGIVCVGPATRSGCGGLCVNSGVACRGCYGPAAGITDQGTKMLSAIAAVIDSQDPDEIESIAAQLDDPVGYLYRFGLAHSTLRRVKIT